MRYAKGRYVLVKKDKSERSQKFKADMETIKKEDVRKLQETFSQFFGADPGEISKQSSKIRNKVYVFGFVVTVLFAVTFFLAKNIKFVGI